MNATEMIARLREIEAEYAGAEQGEVRIALAYGSDIKADRIELDGNGHVYLFTDSYRIARV